MLDFVYIFPVQRVEQGFKDKLQVYVTCTVVSYISLHALRYYYHSGSVRKNYEIVYACLSCALVPLMGLSVDVSYSLSLSLSLLFSHPLPLPLLLSLPFLSLHLPLPPPLHLPLSLSLSLSLFPFKKSDSNQHLETLTTFMHHVAGQMVRY